MDKMVEVKGLRLVEDTYSEPKYNPDLFGKDIFVILDSWLKHNKPLFILPNTQKVINRIPQKNWQDLIEKEMNAGLTEILENKEKYFYGIQVTLVAKRRVIEILKFGCGQKSMFKEDIKGRVKHFHVYENVLYSLMAGDPNIRDAHLMTLNKDVNNKFFKEVIQKYNFLQYSEMF